MTSSTALKNEDLEARRRFFFQTIKSKNWGKILINLIIGALFSAYFIQLFAYHKSFKTLLVHYDESLPMVMDRFWYGLLGYSLIREKLIFNNSL